MTNTADVIIVGGGIIGNATAYYLAKKGVSVIVLEGSDYIGNGGSSRNGGGVRQSGRDKRELPIAIWGIQTIWPWLSEELGVDCEYYQKGNLRLGKTEQHLKTLQALTDNAKSCGLDVSMITGDTAREICPYLTHEVIGASWCPTDGHANPMVTTLAFYRRARQLGVRFFTGARVTEVKKLGGRAREVVTCEGDRFEGATIILAAGYGSRAIANTVGIDVPMSQQIDEALVTEAQPPMFWQMLGTAAADFYGHQTQHGSFVFGGASGIEDFLEETEGIPPTNSLTSSAVCRGIMGYFPALREAKIVRTWSGWLDICADKVPVISPVCEVPGLILACGFSGHGFGIGPAVGKLLSQLAVGDQPEVDLHALRYDRFKANK
ncbi:MAG: FAD-binding oxidoreductase [Intestinimonas sp.]|jgi:sarcosine oxidase subunit beta|nr:FAD-binding oxidoreductase [Intestinimonas sp.]